MMTNLNVGDKALYVADSGAEPVEVTVIAVSAKRHDVRIDKHPALRFKAGYHHYQEIGNGGFRGNRGQLYPTYMLAELQETAKKVQESRKAREDERAKELAEREAERNKERAEVQAVALNAIMDAHAAKKTLPDGSRLYTVNMPINPHYAERKNGYEVLIVRCKDVEDYDFSVVPTDGEQPMKKFVEGTTTWINGGSTSFLFAGTIRTTDDTECLIEAARRVYFSW